MREMTEEKASICAADFNYLTIFLVIACWIQTEAKS